VTIFDLLFAFVYFCRNVC